MNFPNLHGFLLATMSMVGAFGTVRAQVAATVPGVVSGHVTCADSHTPCRFASVTIQSAPPLQDCAPGPAVGPSHTYAAATDLDGAFAMQGVVPGEYYIMGQQAGYLAPYDLAVSEFKGDPELKPKAVEIALARITGAAGQTTNGMHAVRGMVTAKTEGRVVAAGRVRLLDPEDKTMLRETQLEQDGRFSFENVVNGSYVVQVEAQAEANGGKDTARYEPFTAQLLVEGDISNLAYGLSVAKR